MTNIANEQLFELGILVIAAIIYIATHFLCSGLAILISGQKTGVIRGFVQGILLVSIFAISIIFFFNGKIKTYHIITYAGIVFGLMSVIKLLGNKIHLKKKRIKPKVE